MAVCIVREFFEGRKSERDVVIEAVIELEGWVSDLVVLRLINLNEEYEEFRAELLDDLIDARWVARKLACSLRLITIKEFCLLQAMIKVRNVYAHKKLINWEGRALKNVFEDIASPVSSFEVFLMAYQWLSPRLKDRAEQLRALAVEESKPRPVSC